MRREYRERFPRHRFQRKVSDPDMHHGTCVTHVPWCMSGSLTRGGRDNVPSILGACATHNLTYLARGPWNHMIWVCSAWELVVTSNSHWQPSNATRTQTRNTFWNCIMQWHGNNFRVTGPSWREAIGHRWSPSLASDWCIALMFSYFFVFPGRIKHDACRNLLSVKNLKWWTNPTSFSSVNNYVVILHRL